MPHEASWHGFCSTSALGIRFQVGLFVVFDEVGVRLGLSGADGFRSWSSFVVKVFGMGWLVVCCGLCPCGVVKVFRVGWLKV